MEGGGTLYSHLFKINVCPFPAWVARSANGTLLSQSGFWVLLGPFEVSRRTAKSSLHIRHGAQPKQFVGAAQAVRRATGALFSTCWGRLST